MSTVNEATILSGLTVVKAPMDALILFSPAVVQASPGQAKTGLPIAGVPASS